MNDWRRKMSSYKELFLKSQVIIAITIENLEIISVELKKCQRFAQVKSIRKKQKSK